MVKLAEIIYEDIEENKEYENIIDTVLEECFKEEGLDKINSYMSITLTTPDHIRKTNKEFRNIDKETDVLSFPMFEKEEIEELLKRKDSNNYVLGDIIISIPRIYEQAEEYGHSFKRELSYMVVHGFYHILGYDHMNEDDKKVMRAKEDIILNRLKISRED